jgi:ribosomal protein S18 acetylase RimI-like enzyme
MDKIFHHKTFPLHQIPMKIRRIVTEDLDAVRTIAREQLHETYSEELFRYFFEDHPGCFFVAEEASTIVGFVLSIPQDNSMLRVIMLAVGKRWKRKGIGSKLLAQAESYATLRKLNPMVLEVSTVNTEAINFYTKRGYKVTGVLQRYYNDGGDALTMKRYLPA